MSDITTLSTADFMGQLGAELVVSATGDLTEWWLFRTMQRTYRSGTAVRFDVTSELITQLQDSPWNVWNDPLSRFLVSA